MRKPTRRVIEPTLTIGLVILAFSFVPLLGGGSSKAGSLRERVRSGADALGREVRGSVENAHEVDVERLGENARGEFQRLGTGLQNNMGGMREGMKNMRKNVQDLNKSVDTSSKGP